MCLVLYNGDETRSKLNALAPRGKVSTLDHEVNLTSELLFGLSIILSGMLTLLRGVSGQWVFFFCRNFLLISAIIPISMRVTLDMAKIGCTMITERDTQKMQFATRISRRNSGVSSIY